MPRLNLLPYLFAGTAALGGCSDPLTPQDLAGTYSLTRLDSRSLPQLVLATLTCDESVDGGELILDPTGGFSLQIRGTLDCTRGGGQIQSIGWDFPGTFSMADRSLQFISPLYPSGEIHFGGQFDPWRTRIRIPDLDLQLSRLVDLEFRR